MIIYKCDICFTESSIDTIATLNHTFSYGSLRDGESWEIHLCENCLENNILQKVNKKHNEATSTCDY